jgi:hypothetical protein
MDYDGFRQMVLGANLKPIKAGEATTIVKGFNGSPMNFIASYNSITKIGYDEEVVRRTLSIGMDEKLEAPRSQEEFEKYFVKKFKDAMQRYTYLRLVDLDHYRKVFIGDFDSELLIKIIQTFWEQVISNSEFNNEAE